MVNLCWFFNLLPEYESLSVEFFSDDWEKFLSPGSSQAQIGVPQLAPVKSKGPAGNSGVANRPGGCTGTSVYPGRSG